MKGLAIDANRSIRRIKDVLVKHPVIISFYVFVFLSISLITRDIEGWREFLIIFFLLLLSIPSVIVGIFISKDVVPKAGLGYGFAYLTLSVAFSTYVQKGEVFDWFLFNWTLPFLPVAFSIGILATWLGSIVGDELRTLINKKNLKISARTAFLLNYLLPLLIMIYYTTFKRHY